MVIATMLFFSFKRKTPCMQYGTIFYPFAWEHIHANINGEVKELKHLYSKQTINQIPMCPYLLLSYMTGNNGDFSIICKNFFSFKSFSCDRKIFNVTNVCQFNNPVPQNLDLYMGVKINSTLEFYKSTLMSKEMQMLGVNSPCKTPSAHQLCIF